MTTAFSLMVACLSAFVVAMGPSASLAADPPVQPSLRFQPPAKFQGLSIGTGSLNGVYYFTGEAICQALGPLASDAGGCRARTTAGSVENIDRLRSGEDAFAIVQSDVQEAAVRGGGGAAFKVGGPFDQLRLVFSLHEEVLTILVREGLLAVKDADGLKGHRINVGAPGSGDAVSASTVLQTLGWTAEDLSKRSTFNPFRGAAALCKKDLDAVLAIIGHPSNMVLDAVARCGARLVGLSDAEKVRLGSHPAGYAAATIPGGLYPGNPAPVPTVAVRATLVTVASRPDELVHNLVKRVFEDLDTFRGRHPALRGLDRHEMARLANSAPLHPGAQRYYREVDLLP